MSKHQPDDLAKALDFLHEVSKELNLEPKIIDQTMPYLLGLTKHVAHDVVRPAAPLAAFLVGLATDNSDPETARENITRVESLIKEHNLKSEETAE